MKSEDKVKRVYPNSWSQRAFGKENRGWIWAGNGTTLKLVDMDKKGLRESGLWLGAWRRIQEKERGNHEI